MPNSVHTTCCLLMLTLLGTSPGCNSPSEEKIYEVKGRVLLVDIERKSIKLDHEDIPGLMRAMKMYFKVEDARMLEGLAPGDAIEGKMKDVAGRYVFFELRRVPNIPGGKS